MSQYQGTFQRYEEKYLITDQQFDQLSKLFKYKLKMDGYGESIICNIYFDTPDYRLVRTSLEKPVYKEKLRLRSYGTPTEEDVVFVELKKKYKDVVYKRRIKMDLIEAEHYLYDYAPAVGATQITKEIDWFLDFYECLEPAMYISYSRIALYGLEDPELRVTFDRNILYREDELWLECGVWGNPILEEGFRLMEIKIPGTMPLWLSHILNELAIFPVSFSKYGRGYQLSQLKNIAMSNYSLTVPSSAPVQKQNACIDTHKRTGMEEMKYA